MNFNKMIKQAICVKVPNLVVLWKHYFAYLIQVKHLTLKSKTFEPIEHLFQKLESSVEEKRAKTKFSYNSCQNILELYNILVQIRFTTIKRKLDIQYKKLGIRVASQVAQLLKTQDLRKLLNIRKISNLGGHIAQCLSLPSRTQNL